MTTCDVVGATMTVRDAASRMSIEDAQRQILETYPKLQKLCDDGRGDSDEADALRDALDVPWLCLTYKTEEGGNGFMDRMFKPAPREDG